ncbi:hypothetical protein V8F20_009040 [Naviculisporaceae sp. PSN 640]
MVQVEATQVTADGRVIAPLNITNPAPAFNLAGFQWTPAAEMKLERAGPPFDRREGFPGGHGRGGGPGPGGPSQPQKPVERPGQLPGSKEEQLKEQIHLPGGHLSKPDAPHRFPLQEFKGAYAGNGFNMIWVPTPFKTLVTNGPDGPNDNKLLLNLTTEQLTFGPTLGNIPNRGFGNQSDIFLHGFAYMQTVQNVTDEDNGTAGKPRSDINAGIHFEPGVWLTVPPNGNTGASICRMASIPHGTTINAEGLVPPFQSNSEIGGFKGGPVFKKLDTTPFPIGGGAPIPVFKIPMDATRPNPLRQPKDLSKFVQNGTINTDIITNPNIILANAIKGQTIRETIEFEVNTHPASDDALLNGGGTGNISFLAGPRPGAPTPPKVNDKEPVPTQANAHAASTRAVFWIERVEYKVNLTKMAPGETQILLPEMPKGSTAPTPKFAVTAPREGVKPPKSITVVGTQIQYSQIVHLNFGGLTWPHVSVATLVPTDPQPWPASKIQPTQEGGQDD